jgi:phage repressor protein C with HTH and peptisase S24 domain
MLTHTQIWAGVDGLAARYGMTASGLARKAGLDPTTFNKSKRLAPDGRQRWPSTESIAKVLAATGASLTDFLDLIRGDANKPVRTLRALEFALALRSDVFDDKGHPSGADWNELAFPNLDDENAYALEISGDSLLPLYRGGDVLVISPAAPARRGDRVIVRTVEGKTIVSELKRRTAKAVELRAFSPNQDRCVLSIDAVLWISRIVWVSQ